MPHVVSATRRLSLSLWLASSAASTIAAEPILPVAPVRDVVQVLHGVTVHDPYRYLENVKDPQVQAWLRAQGDATRQTLDRIDVRDQLFKRIEALSTAAGDSIGSVMRMPQDRIYYLKRPQGEKQYKLMMRIGLAGAEKVLVDPEVQSRRTPTRTSSTASVAGRNCRRPSSTTARIRSMRACAPERPNRRPPTLRSSNSRHRATTAR